MKIIIIIQEFVRLSGPGSLRFILQPLISAFFGIKDGITDAKLGNDPFLISLFNSDDRKAKIKEAVKSVGKVFIIAIILDVIFYYIISGTFAPLQSLLIGTTLVFIPYSIARGLANRIYRKHLNKNKS
ncbi:MAG TPA: hypothetical protein PK536_13845 [Ignavibacteria bacterium]|nr:hypothetical protein [Ignavibacteria bacterium]HRJ99424.1 hypothetical protein [Ignavibacteria bacterium]